MFINKDIGVQQNQKQAEKSQQSSQQEQGQQNNAEVQSQNHNGKGCNCKKSKCMKMYCDCYLLGIKCTQNCKCINCQNAAIYDSLGNRLDQEDLDASRKFKNQQKGCNCKKSECLKKYCECFNSGAICNNLCKCQQCKNTVIGDTSEHLHSLEQVNSAPVSTKQKNKQINQKILNLMTMVSQQHQQSMLQFLYYLLN